MKLFLFINLIILIINEINSFPLEQQQQTFLPYSFGYQTADGQTRQEQQNQNGLVIGSFSYTDPNGDLRQVKYTADQNGYRPEGDIGIDRRTAESAAEIAALAPKPEQPIQTSWTSSSSSVPHVPVAEISIPKFDKLISPIQTSSWNNNPHSISSPVSNHNFIPSNPPIILPSGYQVDTPTHKIWVKY